MPDDTNRQDGVFLLDLRDSTIERVSVAPDGAELTAMSSSGAISADGRFVAFNTSDSSVEVGDTNQDLDVFVHDRRPWASSVRFALADLEVRPSVVRSGHHVTVSALVKNIGDLTGRYDAVLWVDGEAEDRDTVTVRPDRTEEARFKLRRWELGTYQVAIGPLTAEFTVRPR